MQAPGPQWVDAPFAITVLEFVRVRPKACSGQSKLCLFSFHKKDFEEQEPPDAGVEIAAGPQRK